MYYATVSLAIGLFCMTKNKPYKISAKRSLTLSNTALVGSGWLIDNRRAEISRRVTNSSPVIRSDRNSEE